MIKKYPWHFVYLLFIILSLANIFQKLKWSTNTDNVTWEWRQSASSKGLVCLDAPLNHPIKKGDVLLTIQKNIIHSKIDLIRVIQTSRYFRYDVERNGILKNVGVNISTQYTPFYYFILVFAGIFTTLLTLRILNLYLKEKQRLSPPPIFYLLSLSLSGFLIFSPTGDFHLTDFLFLALDRLSFVLFPAFLVNYALYFPYKKSILRRIKPPYINLCIYLLPFSLVLMGMFAQVKNLIHPDPLNLIATIEQWRSISQKYFAVFLFISLIILVHSNVRIFLSQKSKKYLLTLVGISLSILSMMLFNFLPPDNQSLYLLSIPIPLFPLCATYFLGRRRFTDIEDVIKNTLAISSIFIFIFGISFILGFNLIQNKLLGIFWPIAAILTAGLLYKPIEGTIQTYFERIFFRGTYSFKIKLAELMQSLRSERDLSALSKNFLNTINTGLQLQDSTIMIHFRKNVFYTLPGKTKILLSRNFCNRLFHHDSLILQTSEEFDRRYPKDFREMQRLNYSQFLPLKTKEKLIGLVCFGLKNNHTFLSVDDWELMHSIAPSLTLSVENAFLYSELATQLSEINLLKEFNENIIENINLGLVVLTGLNIIKTWNEFMEVKFKVSTEKAINKKAFSVLGNQLCKTINQGIKGSTRSSISSVKTEIGSEEYIFDIHLSPLKDRHGRITGTILLFEDMTEKILIQNQLITSEKMASLGLLSAGIAHEINTPLTGISSFCQLILDNPQAPENLEMIIKIQEQVLRANRIVRSLLDFSRQSGEQPVEVDINQVINESIALVNHKLKKKNILLKRECVFHNQIFGFPTGLQQMLINLLINSADAIEQDQGMIQILGKETEEFITINIIDNGKGIAEKNLKKVFDPFFTTKGKGEGTGLGLSIIYNIVKKHYGEILAQNNPDQGTTFTITLPIISPLRRIKL